MNIKTIAIPFVFLTALLLSALAQTVADAQKKALAKYPELAREGSPLHAKFVELYRQAKESNPILLADPNWPLTLADKASQIIAAPPAPSTPPAPSPPQPPEVPATPTIPGQTEKIENAFGKRLGDAFDPASAIGNAALTNGTPMYQFSPAKPFRSFTKYFVLITPTTRKIYSIWALGSTENTETGKKEQALLMELLQQKYGTTEKEGMFDALYDTKQIRHGNRSVLTKVTGFGKVTIEVRYYDHDLEAIAEKERLAVEGKKVDASGL
jgi:hypothetical protein